MLPPMGTRAAGAVLCICLTVTACGAKQEQVRTAAVPPSPTTAAVSPSPSAAASGPSPEAMPEPSPSGRAESPAAPETAASQTPPATAAKPPPAAPPKPDHGAMLWNTSWQAVERTRAGQSQPFPAGKGWEVNFDKTPRPVIGWRGACNYSGSDLDVTAERLLVGGDVSSTAIGCDEARLAEDRAATAFFIADPSWSRNGDTLLLTSGDTAIRLVPAGG